MMKKNKICCEKFTKVVLLFISISTFVSTFDDNEFYCKAIPGQYKICRKCPSLNESCIIPNGSGCHCDNIEIAREKGTYCDNSKYFALLTNAFLFFYQCVIW